ncbi:NAD(P)H-dependent oxidoreductase [Lachnospiraceae bacterium ZAX-1]
MLKIALINGSPKLGKSNSGLLLEKLEEFIGNGNDVFHYNINSQPLSESECAKICQMDALVFSFPLYVDSLPSHLLRLLVRLEKQQKNDGYVYVIANNGFFEGAQNCIAFEIIRNWCSRANLHYGQGIAQGAGEMMKFLASVPLDHGPLKNLGNAIAVLSKNIRAKSSGDDILFSPNFPKFAWRFMATHVFWHTHARKNKLKIRDIRKTL